MATRQIKKNQRHINTIVPQPVVDHAMLASLAAFGAGIALGALVGATMFRSSPPPPSWTDRLSRQAHGAMSHILPESIAERWG